jgi:FkbM family methyltransferase
MSFRNLLPAAFRRQLRLGFDSLFCRSGLGLEQIGGAAPWWIAPSLLNANSCVLSGGAGNDISFELTLVERYGCRIALFDPSPTGQSTFDKASASFSSPAAKEKLRYYAIGFSETSQTVTFAAPQDAAEGSFGLPSTASTDKVEFECLSPRDALVRAAFTSIDLLKIDIEGFEYGFVHALLKTENRPPQIAVEVHHFLPHISFRQTWDMVRTLYRAGYRLVHKTQYDYLFIHVSALKRLKN